MEEKKKAPEEEMTYKKKLKDLQMSLLNKMGSPGGLNQNDLMAFSQMMQKSEPDSFKEMTQMMPMMSMLNPQQDPMSQIMPLMIMDGMRGNGDSEIRKELESLKAEMRRRDDDKKFDMVMKEINSLKGKGDQMGTKEFMAMLLNKDEKMSEMWRQMSDKDREHYQNNLEMVLKSKGSGSDIEKLGDQVKQLKALGATLGFGKEGEQSKVELITDMIGGITKTALDSPGVQSALKGYGDGMTASAAEKIRRIQAGRAPSGSRPPQAPQAPLTPEQLKKMQGQGNPGPQEAVDSKPPAEAKPQESYRDGDGDKVYPDLINISDSGSKKVKK